MRILIISNLYPPEIIGGAEIYAQTLARELSKEHQVSVLTTGLAGWRGLFRPCKKKDESITVMRCTPLNFATPYSLRRLPFFLRPLWHFLDIWNLQSWLMVRFCIAAFRPNIVHTHNISGISGSVFTAITQSGVTSVHTLHDYHFLSPWAILFRDHKIVTAFTWWEKMYQFAYRRLTRNIHVVTAPSRFALDLHKRHHFFPTARTTAVPLGREVSTSSIRMPKATIPTFLFVGQVTEYKGVGVIIDALQQVAERRIRIIIAGLGPDRERYMSQSGSDPRIEWPGFIQGKEKNDLIAAAWATIVPSVWYENSPVAIYESLSMGTPVIGSEIGGIPELVRPGDTGWLFSPGSSIELAAIINQVARQPSESEKLGQKSRLSFSNFSLDRHIGTLLELYRVRSRQ